MTKTSDSLQSYRRSREDLLNQVVAELSADDRFPAAWLKGSYARGDEDDVSDLDLVVVAAEPYSDELCARLEQVSHRTTAARHALFSQFGVPALIHENNHNAPEGGTFTFVLYSDSAVMTDWTLIPHSRAKRGRPSRLLFEKVEIPIEKPSPEDLEESRKSVAERWAFFWMMAAITIKYSIRGDLVFVQIWLEELSGIVRDIERRAAGDSLEDAYQRGSISRFQSTREEQLEALQQLIARMQDLRPRVTQFTGLELDAPLAEIEMLLDLAHK